MATVTTRMLVSVSRLPARLLKVRAREDPEVDHVVFLGLWPPSADAREALRPVRNPRAVDGRANSERMTRIQD